MCPQHYKNVWNTIQKQDIINGISMFYKYHIHYASLILGYKTISYHYLQIHEYWNEKSYIELSFILISPNVS